MNTLNIEKELAQKYKYKPLGSTLSEQYRNFFRNNIPSYLQIGGCDKPLYTSCGTKICSSYNRIVIGDYGAFVEFDSEPDDVSFIIQPGQEYRVTDDRYINNVKYIWLTVNDFSGVKIYYQKKTVKYADYIPGKYYVSVHECFTEEAINNINSSDGTIPPLACQVDD